MQYASGRLCDGLQWASGERKNILLLNIILMTIFLHIRMVITAIISESISRVCQDLQCIHWIGNQGHPDNENQSEARTETFSNLANQMSVTKNEIATCLLTSHASAHVIAESVKCQVQTALCCTQLLWGRLLILENKWKQNLC